MTKQLYEKICSGEDVRANLIALRDLLKDANELRAFAYLLGGSFEVLYDLLKHTDPKVRRNAAVILGKLESEDVLPVLFDAYKKEETLFIRADYVKAMENLNCRPIRKELEERIRFLREKDILPEEEKHISAELRALQAIVLKYQKTVKHTFAGLPMGTDLILVTNRCQRELISRQITGGTITRLAGGLRITDANIEEIQKIRTWSEMLFPIKTAVLNADQPEKTGEALAMPLLTMLEDMHRGSAPFLFRVELKNKMNAEKKGGYIRKITDALERKTGGRLINSVNDYEAELRLLEKKDGTFAAMLKLYTLPDRRFAYRGESIAASISPVNAALTAELARPYMKENAQVLDPFCGTGAMLVERNYAVHADTMYGIDLYGTAIEKARVNAEHAGMPIHFINKDFFTFEHDYLFDEIITDMPQVTQNKNRQDIQELYLQFFEKAPEHLKTDGIIILYAAEPAFVTNAVRHMPEYRILDRHTINEKAGTMVFIIRWRGK